MLQITVPPVIAEKYDEKSNEFIYTKIKQEQVLKLEHSLVSISKWESKWNKAFLGKQKKTEEEILDYIRCMTLTQNVAPEVYSRLSSKNYDDIWAYINAPMTATVIPKERCKSGSREVITSELIYYWMISYNIPVEFQKWHINRLITLIQLFNMKNSKPQKRSITEIMRRNAELNALRRRQTNSKG